MKKVAVAVALLAVFLIGSNVYAFGGCEEDCQKCHTLEKKEAQEILSKMKATDVKVQGIKMSPIRGLWEVTLEDAKGGRGVMYVGFSKKYVMGGTIFEVDAASNKTQNSPAETYKPADRYVDPSGIPLDEALLLGDGKAKIKVIVFTDPDCPYCARLHREIKEILSERKDIAFYLMLMPLKFHPDAYWKSESIMCAKSVDLLEDNFDKKPIPKPDCETEAVDRNIALGKDLGITGTPTLVMPDGFVVVGGKDAAALSTLILSHQRKG
jgi:thiol:disulfide interchange protein DsbC